jgi:RNA polymerase sigma factor (sigma-70 family)
MKAPNALALFLQGHEAARFADRSSETVLAEYVAARDEAAFRELLRRHAGHVWAVCRRELSRADLAEDAFQVTFIALVKQARQIRADGSLAGWLDTAARRTAVAIRKAEVRRGAVEAAVPVKDGGEAMNQPREVSEAVRDALADLPDHYRLPLTYRYLVGLTPAEMAKAIGVPEDTGKTRLKRGLKLLREKLGGKGLGIGVVGGSVSVESALTAATERVPEPLLAATLEAAAETSVNRFGWLAAAASVLSYRRTVIALFAVTLGITGALVPPRSPAGGVGEITLLGQVPTMRKPSLLALAAALGLPPSLPAQTFTKVLDTSSSIPIPNGTGNFSSFSTPTPSGSTLVFTGLGSNPTQNGYYATTTAPGGSIVRLVDMNTQIPGGNGNFETLLRPVVFGTTVAFSYVSTSPGGVYTISASGGPVTLIANKNTPSPSGGGNFSDFSAVSLSQNRVYFQASSGGATGPISGVYSASNNGGSLATVADTNTPIPGGSGNFTKIYSPGVNGSNVAFIGLGNAGYQGVFVAPNGGASVSRLVDTSTPVPNGTGNFVEFIPSSGSGKATPMNSSAVAFYGRGSASTGLYAMSINGGSVSTIVDSNTPFPGGGTFQNLSSESNDLQISDAYAVFTARSSLGPPNTLFYKSMSGGPISKIVAVGDTLNGKTVASINGGIEGTSIDGSLISFSVRFTDQSVAVYTFTPVPEPAAVLAVSSVAGAGFVAFLRLKLGAP